MSVNGRFERRRNSFDDEEYVTQMSTYNHHIRTGYQPGTGADYMGWADADDNVSIAPPPPPGSAYGRQQQQQQEPHDVTFYKKSSSKTWIVILAVIVLLLLIAIIVLIILFATGVFVVRSNDVPIIIPDPNSGTSPYNPYPPPDQTVIRVFAITLFILRQANPIYNNRSSTAYLEARRQSFNAVCPLRYLYDDSSGDDVQVDFRITISVPSQSNIGSGEIQSVLLANMNLIESRLNQVSIDRGRVIVRLAS